MLVLSRHDVAACLDEARLIDAVADAFVALSDGRTSVPPRVGAASNSGLLAAMPAFASGLLETKLVSVFPGNAETNTPTHQAVIVLFDPDDGTPVALMDGTHITAVRTAAATAVAVRELARPGSGVLAIIGAGVQGRAHSRLVPLVRNFEEIRVASRTHAHAEQLAAECGGIPVASFADAVHDADVVCLCTDGVEPVLAADAIAPGTVVASVGASQRGGELDPALIHRGRLFVESRVAFEPPPAGATELQGLDRDAASELGEVLTGRRPGRVDDNEILVYKSMGHAVEDAAAAAIVYARAHEQRRGAVIHIG